MSDCYSQFASSAPGRFLVKRLGLPDPAPLRRYRPGDPVIDGPVLLGEAPGGRLAGPAGKLLRSMGVTVITEVPAEPAAERPGALVFDASGIADSSQLRELHSFYKPVLRGLAPCGRVIVLGVAPQDCAQPRQATAQRALEGFVRSVGKELGAGSTASLVYVAPGVEDAIESTLRFLLSPKSAYLSGQVIRIGAGMVETARRLGAAARRQGCAGHRRVARHRRGDCRGAVPRRRARGVRRPAGAGCRAVRRRQPGRRLGATTRHHRGRRPDQAGRPPARAARRRRHRRTQRRGHQGQEAGQHAPAGLGCRAGGEPFRAGAHRRRAAGRRVLIAGGRVISVSSISGIAGNVGQTNYATSKAGVIGMVQSMAPVLAAKDVTINAVAPGFIETAMTAAIPLVTRQLSRRMNSLGQGGLPVDVAETVTWFAKPASGGVTGNVVRVCGQSLIGA